MLFRNLDHPGIEIGRNDFRARKAISDRLCENSGAARNLEYTFCALDAAREIRRVRLKKNGAEVAVVVFRDRARERNHCLNTAPSFITNETFFSTLTSRRGSPLTAITSA